MKINFKKFIYPFVFFLSLMLGTVSFSKDCAYSPQQCSNSEVCFFATKGDGKAKTWNSSNAFGGYVIEAQRRNLQCDVTTTQKKKSAANTTLNLWQIGFNYFSISDRKAIQDHLKESGYYNGLIDGLWGNSTNKAITALAESNGISPKTSSIDDVAQIYSSILGKSIKGNPRNGISFGTAFAITQDGILLTNSHVVEGCTDIKIINNSFSTTAVIVKQDETIDLALLKSPMALQPLRLTAKSPRLMDDIYVAGFPFGEAISSSLKITKGIVSSLSGPGNNIHQFQIDAAIQPGNSGGPIVDRSGSVIGVVVSKLDALKMLRGFGSLAENTGFGIRVSSAYTLLSSNGVELPSETTNYTLEGSLGSAIEMATFMVSCK